MKKIVFCFLLILLTIPLFALPEENYDVQNLIAGIQRAGPPVVKNGYIIFTAEKNNRHVGIAFAHEHYSTVHSFERLVFYDSDYKIVDSILFYISKVPENTPTLSYRLVIDGLWTTDPLNMNQYFDYSTNLPLSYINIEEKTIQVTKSSTNGGVRFVYEGKSGQKIRLTGSFTSWDPFVYELRETALGFYELELYLSPGTYYYSFYNGLTSYIDERNPDRAYTKEGRVASVLTVQ